MDSSVWCLLPASCIPLTSSRPTRILQQSCWGHSHASPPSLVLLASSNLTRFLPLLKFQSHLCAPLLCALHDSHSPPRQEAAAGPCCSDVEAPPPHGTVPDTQQMINKHCPLSWCISADPRKSPRQYSNDLRGSMCDSRSKLSCSSNCCIVLTPAQVIMGCYSVCQSAHSRLLHQPSLPVRTTVYKSLSIGTPRGFCLRKACGWSLLSQWITTAGFQQEQGLTGISQHTPVPPGMIPGSCTRKAKGAGCCRKEAVTRAEQQPSGSARAVPQQNWGSKHSHSVQIVKSWKNKRWGKSTGWELMLFEYNLKNKVTQISRRDIKFAY